ncbi:hypothetical protein SQ11_12300 [Nitrosospira sp. NpAV]|nr:hypothetical protein SQ11_12300 [Nitrosospira sp. NpAV]
MTSTDEGIIQSKTDALISEDERIKEKHKLKIKKINRLEREKKHLLSLLASNNFSTLKTKIAWLLNLYPQARNSDVVLALKYWEIFQPDIYSAKGILPQNLFKLERLHYIVRARAKIQNQYGLFNAEEKIRRHRKRREETMHDAVLEDVIHRNIISIFADETGKNGDFVIVAAVWVLSGYSVFKVTQAIDLWKKQSPWVKQEIHFSSLSNNDLPPLKDYLNVIQENREFLSFKIIAIEKSKTNRKIEDIVIRLYEHMLVHGAQHEVSSGRVDLPRDIELTIDEAQSLDGFTLSEMKERVTARFRSNYDRKLILSTLQTVSSKKNHLIQLADLLAGAFNRRLNHHGDRKIKDAMADTIIKTLELEPDKSRIPGLDATALIHL